MRKDSYRLKLSLNLLVILSFIFIFSIVHATEKIQNKEEDQYLFAKGLYRDGIYQLALKELKIFLGDYPQSKYVPDVLSYIADIYFKQKEESEAFGYYKEIITHHKDYPKREKILIRYFEKQYGSKNYKEALDSVEIIISEYPKSRFIKKAYRYKGEVLL
ncbi:MAG TPA: tetratricopeptide repeat protein, partial [Nitrospinota bacterium]|nr:tetratricopeptide repeat protein [Nitrospinota bacterium]